MTHTYALVELSESAFSEIAGKLRAAGYDQAFHDNIIDMHGLAVISLSAPCRRCGASDGRHDPNCPIG